MRAARVVLLGAGLALAGPALAGTHDPELQRAWTSYLEVFVQGDGRVVDRADRDITTSEGQAYALVRAAWSGDRATFDRVRHWTRWNLQGGDPHALPAWRWGAREDGQWGVIDANPASDADQLIAYALLLGAARSDDPALQADAVGLLARIWDQETAVVGASRVMLPGPWARDQKPVPINPSYLMPFAYRAFAVADPAHPWLDLVASSYALLQADVAAFRLPTDWMWLEPRTGHLAPAPKDEAHKLVFGYDAFRVAFNLAADVQWHDETRARELLARMAPLGTTWRRDGRLPAVIAPDGRGLRDYESLGMYGALLPAWRHSRPDDDDTLFERHIAPLAGRGGWGREDDYYAQNWVWFGVALWSGLAVPPESL